MSRSPNYDAGDGISHGQQQAQAAQVPVETNSLQQLHELRAYFEHLIDQRNEEIEYLQKHLSDLDKEKNQAIQLCLTWINEDIGRNRLTTEDAGPVKSGGRIPDGQGQAPPNPEVVVSLIKSEVTKAVAEAMGKDTQP